MVSERPAWRTLRWRDVPAFLRYLVVGGLNTLFGYAAYAFFVWSGCHFAMASLLGTIAGTCFNFFTTGGLVFDRVPAVRRVAAYVTVYAVAYAINVALLWALTALGLGPYAAGLVILLPMAAVTFVLMRRYVFGAEHGTD